MNKNTLNPIRCTQKLSTTFLHGPLGRRIAKRSKRIVIASSLDSRHYREGECRRQTVERLLDGDQMV